MCLLSVSVEFHPNTLVLHLPASWSLWCEILPLLLCAYCPFYFIFKFTVIKADVIFLFFRKGDPFAAVFSVWKDKINGSLQCC